MMFDEWKTTHIRKVLPGNIKKSIYYDVKVIDISDKE